MKKKILTVIGVIILLGLFLMTGSPVFPAILVVDYFIRSFARLKDSPLSFLALLFVRMIGTEKILIDKAPKIFAARVGLLLSGVITLVSLLNLPMLAAVLAAVLVLFAFLECGLNFCVGCWVYTYVVHPFFGGR